ncbi:MAG TPA: S8 family serine peptidase, partial [Thermoanaerobaculia bacterium]|nr:S8 family serine peptidase [Thermoanaerobaculia bacterium]
GLARRLAARPDVARIEANPRLRMPAPPPEEPGGPWVIAESPEAIEPNLTQVGAPDVWALGYTGLGVVVGGQDTGVQWDHPALQAHYRGWNGSTASHDYNWHDAIHDGDGDCGVDAAEPCDDDDHGTHTIGTMVGDDSGTNRIGMAPGAQWIACRNMQEGVGTPASYTECFEWFVAPTDLDGENPDPERAPHVINNSWSCPDSEGCDEVETELLRAVVENTRAAGIVVVVSAGNGGIGGCSTIVDPAAIYDASFTIGAVDSSDVPASFSSRGPVTVYDPDLMKPDISAPGVSVRSAIRGDNYASFSGTSMSAPHVAGLVALLLSADPSLAGDVDAIEATIRSTAAHPATSTQVCGGVAATVFPNNTFGAGRIDALAAVESLFAGGLIFRDGLELGGTVRWSFVEP